MHAQGIDGFSLLHPQILLLGPGDYTVSGGTSRCIQMVQNAASRIKQSRLMFTPTLFWVDSQHEQNQSPNAQARMQCPFPHCTPPAGSHKCRSMLMYTVGDVCKAQHMQCGNARGCWAQECLFACCCRATSPTTAPTRRAGTPARRSRRLTSLRSRAA